MYGPRSKTTLLHLCFWTWRTAAYVQVPFSDTYYGFDGPWQAVTVNVGGWISDIVDSLQWTAVDLLPGGYYSTFALNASLCNSGVATSDCAEGGTWRPAGGQLGQTAKGWPIAYQPAVDLTASSGVYMQGPIFAQNMNINGQDQYTVPNSSIALADVGNQTLPNGNRVSIELGFFSLGADIDQEQQFTTGVGLKKDFAIDTWLMPGYFYNKSITESYSFTLHLGSTAFNYQGNMMFGGYDKGRAIGPGTTFENNPPLQDIVLGVETGGSPFEFDSKDGLLLDSSGSNKPVTVQPEPMVPYFHLPGQTCENLARQLPVKFDSSIGYYLWDTPDPSYTDITTSAAYLGFKFPPGPGDTDDITIKVPFRLLVLDLTKEVTGKSGKTPYFPCMPYLPSGGDPYLLGRAFLQAAFWGRNFNLKVSWLAQAPGPGSAGAGLGVHPLDIKNNATTLSYYADDGRFADSWKDHWTPLSASKSNSKYGGGGSSSGSKGLSTGAKVGIGVGVIALLVILGLLAWFLIRRRRKTRKASRSPSDSIADDRPITAARWQSTTAAHYGDEAPSIPARTRPGPAMSQHQRQHPGSYLVSPISAPGEHQLSSYGSSNSQPSRLTDEAYASQGSTQSPSNSEEQQPKELWDGSNYPAHELPAYMPHEMEAGSKKIGEAL